MGVIAAGLTAAGTGGEGGGGRRAGDAVALFAAGDFPTPALGEFLVRPAFVADRFNRV